MAKKREFDPPISYGEIGHIHDFTRNVLSDLGLPQWRMQFIPTPCGRSAYATVEPAEDKHVAELKICADWLTRSLAEERIPTLIHECLHLTHAELTRNVSDEAIKYIPMKIYSEYHDRWITSIELWTDQMTQVILAAWGDRIAEWAEEIWGTDWRTIGED